MRMTPNASDGCKRRCVLLVVALALSMLIAACGDDEGGEGGGGGEEAQETVTLSAVSFLPPNHPITEAAIPDWIETIERESGGSIKIDYRGGPEAIPTEDQFGAVVDGLVDIGFNVPTFYLNEVPTGNTMHLSPFTPGEERDNGYFEFLDQRHREGGAAYLGRWMSAMPFYLWSNSRISSLDELRGKRMRTSPTYQQIFDALQVKAVNILPPEVFTALERGVVDGFAFPLIGPRETGWLEVTEYLINAPFYNQNGAIVMNPDKLDELSDEQRQTLTDATSGFEDNVLVENFLELHRTEWKETTGIVDVVDLEPQQLDEFTELWYEEGWTALVDLWKADQAAIDEAQQLLGYDEFTGDPEKIRDIPCAAVGDEAADEPFCYPGK
jgi:TRAP-type C4-dicarboxylate transport system substrate-binding protein